MCFLDIQIYNTEIAFRKEIWNCLQQAKSIGIHPFITDEEVEKEKNYTLAWYEDKENTPKIVTNIITLSDVIEFVVLASDEISHRLKVLFRNN